MLSTPIWKFRDICLVSIIVIGAMVVIMPLFGLLFGNAKILKYLFPLSGVTIMLLAPVMWIKKYYKLGMEALGIRKGRWSLKSVVLFGAGSGLIFFLAESIVIWRKLDLNLYLDNFPKILSFTLSVDGFITFLYGPISEEIFFRGFLFGYMRSRLGHVVGLLAQALVFGFVHFAISPVHSGSRLIHGFFVGLLCGVLYGTSDSLYPSIIFHGTLNYLLTMTKITQLSP